jgi:PEP-CTERM motif
MKSLRNSVLTVVAFVGLTLHGYAVDIVNDTWIDGTRTDPAAPIYSENGTDTDLDGNIESVWYLGGAGTLAPVGAGGPLRGDLGVGGTGSGSWTTYFTAGATPITLANPGDSLKVTWQFTLTGTAAANTSQNLRLALVNTPPAALLAADASPGSSTYAGYGMLMNMGGPTLGNSNPFQLVERIAPGTSSALLSAGGSWTALGNGATSGNAGYADGTPYTYVMQLTLNGSGGVDIVSTMTGGTLNGSGSASVALTDTTPNSTNYNTFAVRPSSATGAAQIFDTSLFKVEFTSVPEPSTIALAGLAMLGFVACYRRMRR